MEIVIIVGVLIAIIGIILIVLINQYNKFQWAIIKIDKGETNISNALVKKHSILTRYIEYLKNNKVEIDEEEFDKYKLLNLKMPIDRLNQKIDEMNNIVQKYMDNNEKLLKNETIVNINKELNDVNIIINGGKKYYNDNLVIYNHLCSAFPSNIVAKIYKYNEKEFLNDEIKEELKILE